MLNSDGLKRIVVIKDIKSNMIEEAILVLKNTPAVVNDDNKETKKDKRINSDFLLKEAEIIIDNYLKENKNCFIEKTRREKRKKLPFNKLKLSTIINIILAFSLVILALLISKLL